MSSISGLNSLLSSSSGSSSFDLSSLLQAATGATSPGIDVNAAVQAAIYAARSPERQWQGQQSTIAAQIAALTTMQSTLSKLSTDLNNLNNLGGTLAARTVSSSSSAVNATAAAGATLGSHSVAVQTLATTSSWYSPALLGTATLGNSALTITSSDGTSHTFATGKGTNTLTALAQTINSASAGVTASVITDTTGSRLALVSTQTGAAADFSVNYGAVGSTSWSSANLAAQSTTLPAGTFQVGDGTSTSTITISAGSTLASVANCINAQGLSLTASVTTGASGAQLQIVPKPGASVSVSNDPAFSFIRASTAQNAALTVDGVPVSSASNTVNGAAAGLTLHLTATTSTGAPAILSVAADTSAIQQLLSSFVADYNAALSTVGSQFTYNTTTSSQGVLSGDSAVRSLQSVLLGIGAYTNTNASNTSSGNAVRSLADLGITMGNDGSLTLDNAKLNSALANPSDVQTFFQGSALNGFAQQVQTQLTVFSSPANGALTQEISNLNQQYIALGREVSNYETGYIASQKTLLTAMYSKAEIALQQLPTQMKQMQTQLSNNSSGG